MMRSHADAVAFTAFTLATAYATARSEILVVGAVLGLLSSRRARQFVEIVWSWLI